MFDHFYFFAGIIAIGLINEALEQGIPEQTLQALLSPSAKLREVIPENSNHYHNVLQQAKTKKCKVCLACDSIKCCVVALVMKMFVKGSYCHFRYNNISQCIF